MTAEKISDLELIRMYNNKFSDSEIASIKKVSVVAVRLRRYKLGLAAHGINAKKVDAKRLMNIYNKREKNHSKLVNTKGKIATLLRKKHPELYEELRKEVSG